VSFLLDTNIVSAMRRRDRLPPNARQWLQAQLIDELYMSALTMMELEIGIQRLGRYDPRQATMLRAWKDGPLERHFHGRILGLDLAICERCAALHVPDPRPEIDALIAATAIVRNLTLVTRNQADFEGLPVRVFNPWQAAR
jgi:toxin FitB